MFYGLLDLPWWAYIAITLIATQITIAAVTLYLHRCQAHRALEMHPILSHFFRAWLWLFTGMVTKEWAAIHRKHHARCETKDDPHSPQIHGLKKILFLGAEFYRCEANKPETLDRFGKGTPDDWIEKRVYSRFPVYGVISSLILETIIFGVPGLAIWAIQMAWIPFFAAGIINGVGHYIGYRNYETEDASRNIFPIGFFIGGEELHNNHHTYPTSAKFSAKKWEFDIGWMYILIFRAFGLIKIKRTIPMVSVDKSKTSIDAETLTALISNRIQVMTNYSKQVLVPLHEQESHNIPLAQKGMWRRAKSLLIKESARMDPELKVHLTELLSSNKVVHQASELRTRLQDIWNKTHWSQKELIEALQAWCRDAEASGHRALQEFAEFLRGYRLSMA